MRAGSFCVLSAALAACAPASAPPSAEEQAEFEEPPTARVGSAKEDEVPIDLLSISASRDDHELSRVRWTGAVEVTGELAPRSHLLGKTSCAADRITVSEMANSTVDDLTASMGDPWVGAQLKFDVHANVSVSSAGGPCELALYLLDGTNRLSRAAAGVACFSRGETTVGACDPALPRPVKPRWALHGFAFNDYRSTARFVVQLGATARPSDELSLKTTCLHETKSRPRVVVGASRTWTSWRRLDVSDAAETAAYVDSRIFAGATRCVFDVQYWRRSGPGDKPSGGRVIGTRCWSFGGGTHSCRGWYADDWRSGEGRRTRLRAIEVQTADMHDGGGQEFFVDGFLTAAEPLPASAGLRATAFCGERRRECARGYAGGGSQRVHRELSIIPVETGESVIFSAQGEIEGHRRATRISLGYALEPSHDPIWLEHYCPPESGRVWTRC